MDSMVQVQSIKKIIRSFILSNFLPNHEDNDLRDDDLLFEGGIIDSAGAMMLIAFIDEQFGISVPDEELFPENFATIDCIMEYIHGKRITQNNSDKRRSS